MRSDPSRPPRVLVAGGTGFVGRELVRRLVATNGPVRVTTRHRPSVRGTLLDEVQLVTADWITGLGTDGVADGIQVAYYLVHSMGGRPDFAGADRLAATRFAAEMARGRVERIVYLGGLGDENDSLSPHLASRREV